MGRSYAPRGTAVAPGVEASVGQEAAAPRRASAARSNQEMQGRLPAAPPDCALGDEACGLDVTLDEVLGEGAQEEVDALMSDITRRVGRVAARLSELRDPELEATY